MTIVGLFVLFSVTGGRQLSGRHGDGRSDGLSSFAFTIFVYFVADVFYPRTKHFFFNSLCCETEHRRVVEKTVLTFAARDLNGAGVCVCV